jgi:hypothetical protein
MTKDCVVNMEKEQYEAPEMQIYKFESEDIMFDSQVEEI